MNSDIGPQYESDDAFKAKARLHQSIYSAEVLGAGFSNYGNRLEETSAQNLDNYYSGLNVRQELKSRYGGYSQQRDADMHAAQRAYPIQYVCPAQTEWRSGGARNYEGLWNSVHAAFRYQV